MRRFAGQAAGSAGRIGWKVLRLLLAVVLGCLIVGGAGFVVLAWWLAQGPVEMPWLAARIQMEASSAVSPGSVRVGGAALAWEGFHAGLNSPVDIRLRDVSVRLPSSGMTATAPEVRVVLGLGPLITGRIRPSLVGVHGARVMVDGAMSWPHVSPRQSGRDDLFGGLREVLATDAEIAPAGQQGWAVHHLATQIYRGRTGISGQTELDLTLRGASAHVSARGVIPDSGDASLHINVPSIPFSAVATAWPALKNAATAFAAPVGLVADVTASADLVPKNARMELRAGAGTLRTGDAPVAVDSGEAQVTWAPGELTIADADLLLRPRPDRAASRLQVRATVRLGVHGLDGKANLTLDQLAFDDLAALWPGNDDGRRWVIENITSGVARDGHVSVGFAAKPDGSNLQLTSAAGTIAGSDLTVHWLRPVPPVEHGKALLHITNPDSLRVDFISGQDNGLTVRGGGITISGLTQPEQTASIEASVGGKVVDALALLAHPRLHLLSKHPIPLKNPQGHVDAEVSIRLPLNNAVTMDQIALKTTARLSDVHLADVVAGHDLDQGAFVLSADGDGLTLNGTARVADLPARIEGAFDFRAGPPDQVVERLTVSGRARAEALARAGLDTGGIVIGPVDVSATYTRRRNATAEVATVAGLTDAELRLDLLGWHKPRGEAASVRARLMLDKEDRLRRIEAIEVDGHGIAAGGGALFGRDGSLTVNLDRLVLGETEAKGTIALLDDAKRIRAKLTGPRLDLSGRFGHEAKATPPPSATSGPYWTVDATFGSVILAKRQTIGTARLQASGRGERIATGHLSAHTAPGKPVDIAIDPDNGGRILRATAADGGAVLRALGVADSIQGGALAVSARYLDQQPGRPLTGTATMDNFTVRGAPVLARVLQALTLYGLVQAVQGPGMRFEHLAMPFTFINGVLVINDARAFNPSLGLTAKGEIDIDRNRIAVKGTIVPAYYVNTALGRIPLIGRLFSPEKGGGVFAARYSAQGSLDDPAVSVNPLSALTPGFLRGLFGR